MTNAYAENGKVVVNGGYGPDGGFLLGSGETTRISVPEARKLQKNLLDEGVQKEIASAITRARVQRLAFWRR